MANPSNDPSPESAYHEAALSEPGLPPLDFTTFVLSMSTSALVSMGQTPGSEGQVDLQLARQTIDLIALLQDKTKGNLTGEEERLLDQVLLDLRIKFVQVASRAPQGAPPDPK
jgi:hypothetical protein